MQALEAHVKRQVEHSRDFFWHRVRWAAVSAYLPRDHAFTVIDIGAGAGLLGMFISRDRPRGVYMFVETLPSLERHLESVYGSHANARGIDSYEEARFVALLDVLEHQEDDHGFLADIVLKMRPGSRLLVTVPALTMLWSKWDVNLGHRRRYNKASLRATFEGLPIHIVEMSYLFPEMLPLGLVRRLRRSATTDPSENAEFPDLPSGINDVLFHVGSVSLRLRRWWPAGTSLMAVVERG